MSATLSIRPPQSIMPPWPEARYSGSLAASSDRGVRTLTKTWPVAGRWFEEFSVAISQFADLSQGWDSYDAPPPSSASLRQSSLVLDQLWKWDAMPMRVAPLRDGGIIFWLQREEGKWSIEVDQEGVVEFTTPTGEAHSDPLDPDCVLEEMGWRIGVNIEASATAPDVSGLETSGLGVPL